MSNNPLKLVSKDETARSRIVELLLETIDKAKAEDVVGCAAVIVRRDGSSFVTTFSHGSRVLLLGCVADLQYTLAKDGDN